MKDRLKSELPEDINFQSSPNQVRSFQEHITWRDMRTYLDDHILWCYGQMESVESLEELKGFQGEIRMAKAILGLPDHIIEESEVENGEA